MTSVSLSHSRLKLWSVLVCLLPPKGIRLKQNLLKHLNYVMAEWALIILRRCVKRSHRKGWSFPRTVRLPQPSTIYRFSIGLQQHDVCNVQLVSSSFSHNCDRLSHYRQRCFALLKHACNLSKESSKWLRWPRTSTRTCWRYLGLAKGI